MHQKFPIWINLWDTFIVLGGFLKHSVSLFGWTSRKVNNRLAGKRGFFFHHYHLCRASKEWCLNVVSRQEISFSYYLSLSPFCRTIGRFENLKVQGLLKSFMVLLPFLRKSRGQMPLLTSGSDGPIPTSLLLPSLSLGFHPQNKLQ